MPILITDHSWRQTEDKVIIRVPLRNIPHTKVDLFHSDIYVKVHFPPFLFECCLYEPINEDNSKCTLVEGEAVFDLIKAESKQWPTLNKEVSKQEMIVIKKEAIEHAQKRAEEIKEKNQEKLRKRRSDCIGQQISLDDKGRGIIKEKKEYEKRKAFDEIMDWKEKETDRNFLPNPLDKAAKILRALRYPRENEKKSKEDSDDDDEEDEKVNKMKLNRSPGTGNNKEIMLRIGKEEISERIEGSSKSKENSSNKDKEIWDLEEVPACEHGTKEAEKEVPIKQVVVTDNKKENINVPPLRESHSITVDFTYRAFPTPSRESSYKEEQEWLVKQKEARRKTGFVAEDLRPEENDPIWLLEKGRSFHEIGNYLGAISAFTHALRTWNKIPELYIARSNSQVCIGNFRRVLEDTTEALGLLKPYVNSNAEMRFQAHYNRGKALLELGKGSAAMADFVEALEIHPYREDVHNLMDRAESLIEEEKARNQEQSPPEGEVPREFIEPDVLAN